MRTPRTRTMQRSSRPRQLAIWFAACFQDRDSNPRSLFLISCFRDSHFTLTYRIPMNTHNDLRSLFNSRYKLNQLTGRDPGAFVAHLKNKIGSIDAASEGYADESRQRDLSIKFHWGHNHDF